MKQITVLMLTICFGFSIPTAAQNGNSTPRRHPAISPVQERERVTFPASIETSVNNFLQPDVWKSKPKPNTAEATRISQLAQPGGNWGGAGCPSATLLKSLVDNYLSSTHPNFPELGRTVPGVSVSWSSPICGTFTYATGLRNIEQNKLMTPATLMGIASMTKPIIAAITLQLSDSGVFGPNGLDTTIDELLTPQQITALTVGENPLQPKCPGFTYLFNRDTYSYEWKAFSCPDLSQVTLRHLMRANHGMYDFISEVLLPNGSLQIDNGVFFDLYQFLGLDPVPPVNSRNGFDYLKEYGLKRNDSAALGGASGRDFERSFGNTGFQLLAVILEQKTGRSLDDRIEKLIVEPLKIDPIFLYVDRSKRSSLIADSYDLYTGEPLIETTGVYPIVNHNGHTAINTLSLGLGHPANINLAGGAGGLVANPKSYRVFLNAFVDGGLLSPAAQNELNHSYVAIPDLSSIQVGLSNGFGLFEYKLRGFAGLPDLDIISHGGLLPGVRCENAVMRPPDSAMLLATGVICQNASFGAADPFSLELEFINAMGSLSPGP